MPPASGCATRSSTSRPSRRVTNDARLSSRSSLALGNHRLECDPQLAPRREQRAGEHRPQAHRREQRKSHRNFDQPPAPHDVGFAELRARRNQLGFEADARASCAAHGFSVRNESAPVSITKPSRATVEARRPDLAAFEDRHLDRPFARDRKFADAIGRGESGDTAADDRDARNFSQGVRRSAPVELSYPDAFAPSPQSYR